MQAVNFFLVRIEFNFDQITTFILDPEDNYSGESVTGKLLQSSSDAGSKFPLSEC